jgi:hypothetical protein
LEASSIAKHHAQFWKHCQLQNIMLNFGSIVNCKTSCSILEAWSIAKHHAQFWKHRQLQNIMLNLGSTDLQNMLPQEKDHLKNFVFHCLRLLHTNIQIAFQYKILVPCTSFVFSSSPMFVV